MNEGEINKKFTAYIEYRLQEWANWFDKGNFYGIGFSTSTIEYRLMTEGIVSNQPGYKTLHCNDEAEEIENLISEMHKQNFKMSLALRHHYFGYNKSHDRRSALPFSRTQLQTYLGMGRQWLAGRLSAKVKMVDLS